MLWGQNVVGTRCDKRGDGKFFPVVDVMPALFLLEGRGLSVYCLVLCEKKRKAKPA